MWCGVVWCGAVTLRGVAARAAFGPSFTYLTIELNRDFILLFSLIKTGLHLHHCKGHPEWVETETLVAVARDREADGSIEALENLHDHRVYLYRGEFRVPLNDISRAKSELSLILLNSIDR